MMKITRVMCVVGVLLSASCAARPDADDGQAIIDLERAALDRWGKGDPDGYLEIMAPEVTYFDPSTPARRDGRDALKPLLDIIRGRLSIDSFEIIEPKVIRSGDMAILSLNLISRGASFNGSPKRDAKWNITEVYRRIDGSWKIVHSHFSNTTPQPSPMP
jgi:ketosteroid isomerase-like protein